MKEAKLKLNSETRLVLFRETVLQFWVLVVPFPRNVEYNIRVVLV